LVGRDLHGDLAPSLAALVERLDRARLGARFGSRQHPRGDAGPDDGARALESDAAARSGSGAFKVSGDVSNPLGYLL
jgi:hypothetical protein